jgi:amino acid transporter
MLGIDAASLGYAEQVAFLTIMTAVQAVLIFRFARLTTLLTDFSGYLILVLSLVLTVSLLIYSPVPLDLNKLVTFTNFTGKEGSPWPEHSGFLMPFLSGLLLTIYTITGFDASAHTSEETRNAAAVVPRGIITSVLYSGIFGFILICTFVLVMPDLEAGVKMGMGYFEALLSSLPAGLRSALSIGIFVANFLCGLACLTSCSRMMYAFARDGGLPASDTLRKVHPTLGTPIAATLASAVLAVVVTLYGDGFVVLSTGCAVFLYISYVMPTAAGVLAEGKTWTQKGPFDLGRLSKPIAVLAVLGGALLVFVGMQPPNEKVLYLTIAMIVGMIAFWFLFGESKRFKGPPNIQ